MDTVLDELDILIGTIAGTDLHTLDVQNLMSSTLRLCKQLDQM